MTTALDLITAAMRKIKVLGSGKSPDDAESADGLADLNSMLDAWSIDRLLVYQVKQTTHSWPAATVSRTIGSGGDFNVTRPYKVSEEGNFFRTSGSLDYQLCVYPRELYDRKIVQKTAGGSIPEFLFVDTGFPLMTLYAYPVPSEALTLHLNHWTPLQSFSALTTELSLPPGYQAAIEFNLGIWIAPGYGVSAEHLEKQAAFLKASIGNVNQPSLIAEIDPALVAGGGRRSRIESDS